MRNLLAANGISLGEDDAGVQRLNDWFGKNVEARTDRPDRLRNLWYAVVHDVALFLGDVLISRQLETIMAES